jgi:hypothetical protein
VINLNSRLETPIENTDLEDVYAKFNILYVGFEGLIGMAVKSNIFCNTV